MTSSLTGIRTVAEMPAAEYKAISNRFSQLEELKRKTEEQQLLAQKVLANIEAAKKRETEAQTRFNAAQAKGLEAHTRAETAHARAEAAHTRAEAAHTKAEVALTKSDNASARAEIAHAKAEESKAKLIALMKAKKAQK